MNQKHESHMRWAIALALEGLGRTSPNPLVGAVVVKDDRILGEGYHCKAGTPHAEIHALGNAGGRSHGADLYVTMEPCCHHGKTPPCVDAIIKAGIGHVIIGTKDPNPLVNGKGIMALKAQGIRVTTGILEASCKRINEPYNKFIVSGIPHITAKVAMSLDGKIATSSGQSKWITNADCRQYVHRLRSRVDAVMVGGGTVRKDDPRLNVRMKGWRGTQPLVIVVDESLDVPRNSKIMRRGKGQVIFVTTNRAPASRLRFIDRSGHEVILCRATAGGYVFLPHMLDMLGRRGISSILLEGGGELFSDFIGRGLVDRLVACLAPKLIGGGGKDFLPGLSISKMKDVLELKDVSCQNFGDNVAIEGKVKVGGASCSQVSSKASARSDR